MKSASDVSLQRIVPHSGDAERAVLGALLLRNDSITEVVELIDTDDFYFGAHKILFKSMRDLYERDGKFDLVSLKEFLRGREALESSGGVSYLMGLLEAVPTAANIEQHAKIVQQKAILRRLIETADQLLHRSYEDTEEVEKLLAGAESELLKLSERMLSHSVLHISKIIGSTFDSIEKLYHRRELVSGLPTGFIDFDKLTSGLHMGDLIIVAARPSMGKTTFALNIAHYLATEHSVPVALFSLEMSKEQLVTRLLSAEALVDGHKLRSGFLNKEDWPKLTQALGKLNKAPIYIDDTPALSPFMIRAKARRLVANYGIKLIMIDYLQLMQGNGRYESRQQEISEISRSLKTMAKELNIPVVALSQLSRAVEVRDRKKRPQLSDLRESGAIEQDADLVAFLYRAEVYDLKTIEVNGREIPSENIAEVIVAKHRNGPIGNIHVAFQKNYMSFRNLQHETSLPAGNALMSQTSDEDDDISLRLI